MRQATLAPIAHAPATPPRAADEAALFNTSRKLSVFSSLVVVVLLMFVLLVCIFYCLLSLQWELWYQGRQVVPETQTVQMTHVILGQSNYLGII